MARFPFAAAILSGVLLASTPPRAAESLHQEADSDARPENSFTLEEAIWSLQMYWPDGGERKPVSSRDARLRFIEGKISGSGGCNRDWLAFGPIAATGKTCLEPDGVMEQEATILRALETVAKYKIEGGDLTLLNGDDKPAAKFRAAE
jgi:heat shock protein HslJ